jgi:ElaB/YqjD/DUF883 family membrane-anchored ribosome-binding protein
MDSQQTRETDKNKDSARGGFEPGRSQDGGMAEGGSTMEQAKEMARNVGEQTRNVGEQARNMASTATATAQDLARRAREQTSAATDTLYQQSTQAGEYLTRNVHEYPLTALLIAGAVGYGLGYLIHSRWTTDG